MHRPEPRWTARSRVIQSRVLDIITPSSTSTSAFSMRFGSCEAGVRVGDHAQIGGGADDHRVVDPGGCADRVPRFGQDAGHRDLHGAAHLALAADGAGPQRRAVDRAVQVIVRGLDLGALGRDAGGRPARAGRSPAGPARRLRHQFVALFHARVVVVLELLGQRRIPRRRVGLPERDAQAAGRVEEAEVVDQRARTASVIQPPV